MTRNKNPLDVAVLSVTQLNAGEASNVIPDAGQALNRDSMLGQLEI
jgi:metal-dependent amidase/aminoacylase/carboxypeptidase family protein